MAHLLPHDPRASRVLSSAAHEALSRARQAVARAREDAEEVREAARAEGFARGRAEAAAVLAEAAVARDRFLAGAGPELVALALLVARKLLGEEPRTPPELAAALALGALREARERKGVTVRVNAADAGAVRAALPEGIGVEPDPAVAPGGCALETPAGRIEAGLDAQLAELARALGAGEEAP